MTQHEGGFEKGEEFGNIDTLNLVSSAIAIFEHLKCFGK